MDTSFDELKAIMEQINTGQLTNRTDFHQKIVDLLVNHGIRLRQRDGTNPLVTISYPTSVSESMVVGLRYTKLDETKTEDHFLFQPGQVIVRCYGKRLERLLHEYRGAHKLQR